MYEAGSSPTVESTVKFKKPIIMPSVFMVRTKVKREVGK